MNRILHLHILFFMVIFFTVSPVFASSLPTCVYISSYHKGYEWSDGVELSLKRALNGHCSLIQFDMDTKRNSEESYIRAKAKEAKELIEKTAPDIVITSDDNAAKFVVAEYFKNSSIPFIFCGVNWTAKEYGFPYKNVTGMIEVTPVTSIFELAVRISKGRRAIFLGDNTLTENKDFTHFERIAKKSGIELEKALVDNVEDWKQNYLRAQEEKDFIILGHNSAIAGWEDEQIVDFQKKVSSTLVLTTYRWMVPFAMVGLIINPEEQGRWAGEAAVGVLEGFPIEKIAIIANRSWSSWMNPALVSRAGVVIPEAFVEKSQQYVESEP